MESIFEGNFDFEQHEAGAASRSSSNVQLLPVNSEISRKPKRKKMKSLTKLAWWEGLSEEDKISFRYNRKIEILQGLERLSLAMETGVNICVELSWDNENSPCEKKSLCKQLSLCYAMLKRTEIPVHLHVTSLIATSDIGRGLESQGIQNWKISTHEESAWDIFGNGSIVMLSPDAEIALEDISLDKTYVIGGIVDKTVRKGRTSGAAIDLGIPCRRLPIQEFVPMRVTHILNVDTVLSILCEFLKVRDWRTAIVTHMPQRRQHIGINRPNTADEDIAVA